MHSRYARNVYNSKIKIIFEIAQADFEIILFIHLNQIKQKHISFSDISQFVTSPNGSNGEENQVFWRRSLWKSGGIYSSRGWARSQERYFEKITHATVVKDCQGPEPIVFKRWDNHSKVVCEKCNFNCCWRHKIHSTYRKVPSSRLSWLVAHSRLFRLFYERNIWCLCK